MDKELRNRLQRATLDARRLLEGDFRLQLEGLYDILPDGSIAPEAGLHLDGKGRVIRERLVAALAHRRANGASAADAVSDYVREAAFTTLNRFVALKMGERRGLVQECLAKGDSSAGFREFTGLAPGLSALPDKGYRLYLECILDELAGAVAILFDRRSPASLLWPRQQAFEEVLEVLNARELDPAWGEEEAIGWVYQYFNSKEEREAMRAASAAPRNSHELAVRNQFFTPRYVVAFLVENTLGRIWFEMRKGETTLRERCQYLVFRPDEDIPVRPMKDPRDLKILDPACGSGHFLLYSFEVLQAIYEEAWQAGDTPTSQLTGQTLREDYPGLEALHRALPGLVLSHNLHGIDIDPRCAQIAAFALWLRAQRAFQEFGVSRADRPSITRTRIVVAEPMPGEAEWLDEFAGSLDATLGDLVRTIFERMRLAGDLGSLLRIEGEIRTAVEEAQQAWSRQMTLYEGNAGPDRGFWDEAEGRVYEALRRMVEGADSAQGFGRRLFAEDTARGLGLVDVCRQQYEAVLMNPPFGAGSLAAKKRFEAAYPRTKNDVYTAFVERGIELLAAGGMLGAITSRSGFFLSTFQRWREEVLLGEAWPTVVADLGAGVLDSAMVETAAYCLRKVADLAISNREIVGSLGGHA